MLQLTTFEIFAFRVPEARVSDFGDPCWYCPQKGRSNLQDRYVPSCKISRGSVAPLSKYLSPNKKTELQQMIYQTNLILALRLSDNN